MDIHASGVRGHECKLPGAKSSLCQDLDYQARYPAQDICFNTMNGCEPFQTFGVKIPDAKCEDDRVRNNPGTATRAPRTVTFTRWLRAGNHPVRIVIGRRFQEAMYDRSSFEVLYKGPDAPSQKTLSGAE